MAHIKNTGNKLCWWGCGKINFHPLLVGMLLDPAFRDLERLELSYGLANTILAIFPQDTHTQIHSTHTFTSKA